jgi:hypothetical protein
MLDKIARFWKWFLGLGLVSLIGMAVVVGQTLVFTSSGESATGTVLDLKPGGGRRSAGVPVVEFRATTGERVQFVGRNPLGRSYRIGQSVPVRYQPQAPWDALIDRFESLWLAPVIGGAAAVMLVPFGLFLRSRTRRRGVRAAREGGSDAESDGGS